MKKVMAIALTALLALNFVSCGGNKNAVSVFTIQQKQQPPADNKIYKWMKEKFDMEFAWDILVGDKDQRIGLLISSDDLPDLVEVDSTKFQDAGKLVPLEDLIEQYGPNIKKHYADVWAKIVEDDGHVYCLPNWGVYDGPDQGTFYNQNAFWIQKEVLKEFGYPEIKTVDVLFDYLEKYVEKYPTIDGLPTIPFSILTYDWEAFNLWNPPQFLAGYPNDGNGHVDLVKGKYVYTDNFIDANAKKWFKFANKMYQKKLIDQESFTDNHDQYMAKVAQGRVLCMFIQGWEFQGDAENTLKTSGKYNRTYAPLPVVFDESIKPHYRDITIPNVRRGYGITIKCPEEKRIKIVQFWDEMLKEENQKILQWGFEGEDWQFDDQGRPSRTQKQRDEQVDNNWILHNKASLYFEEAPKMEGSFSDGYATVMDNQPWEFQANAKPEDIEFWNAYGVPSYAAFVDKNPPANAGWYPMWQEVPSDGSEEQLALTKVETVQRRALPELIQCSPDKFDALWSAYVKDMKDAGIDKYVAFMQSKLDARVAKFGGFPED